MSLNETFDLFWTEVQASAEAGEMAKLTLAKTIGKQNLRNIFVRPTFSEGETKVLLKKRYRSRDTQDLEGILNLQEAREVVEAHLQKPFWSVILFTTQKDLSLKINKKGAGTLVEGSPSFSEVVLGELND